MFILAPTRELVLQIERDALGLTKYVPASVLAVYGGMDYRKQQQTLERQTVDIMAATPGRLLDFKRKGGVNLGKVEIMVIDEADRMLDMGFAPQLKRIFDRLPSDRQTMLFSATMPQEIVKIATTRMKMPVRVEVAPQGTASERVAALRAVIDAIVTWGRA